jgi:PST family polysaccharide transporter
VPIVSLVYPVDYRGASAALAVLALLGAARVFLDFGYDLLSGIGRTRSLFLLQVLWIVVLVPALVIGAHVDDIAGVATAHVLVAVGLMIPAFILVVSGRGPSARAVISQVARPTGAALSAWIVGTVVIHQTSSDAVAILAGGTALVATYVLLAAPFAELWTLPRRLLRFEPAAR